ncbi:ATP-binding protein [Umezawaea beigongshangensis]|uniref:ATP-binding protein n=1 Tax=Umezawaea beigongshangensis TaxID=2780383 RepID=UPI0027DB3D52|nr:ATP-binding protein [Umezawaea beigongshangensis]
MGRRGLSDVDVHQRALASATRAVLARLDAHAGVVDAPVVPEERGDEVSALDALCACFGLTPFERSVLVLTAAAETDASTAARCAAASGDPHRDHPTFSLALAALENPHWSALTPVAPLRRWQLIEVERGAALTTSPLRIDERVLHYLAGVPHLDVRLRGMLTGLDAPTGLPASQRDAAREISAVWEEREQACVQLCGADQQTRWEVAAEAARLADASLHAVTAEDLPSAPVEREALARLWEREALLLPGALLLEVGEPTPQRLAAVRSFVGDLGVPVVVSSADPVETGIGAWPRVTLSRPTQAEQRALWTTVLGDDADDRELADVVEQFSLPAHVIRRAGASARAQGAGGAWRAGLAHARIALDELGHRVEPRATERDLVLPSAQHTVLDEIVAHVRQRAVVYQDWGFDSVLRRGLGVTALFAGGSGTGKTLAAEVLAGRLGLDLFVIDLSQVISKYIGETEKNLRRVFDAAEGGGALLLFDEADALFGKRSEIKDSHDRYANIEVSYLLMRMEAYRGLAILTTNMKKALDTAFLRRIRFVVDFPFPGPAERAEIWRRVIPARTPVDDLDPERLAQLTVAGGSIRNVALSAAFLAAEEGVPLAMRHVLASSRTEYLKLERSLTSSEVAGWV